VSLEAEIGKMRADLMRKERGASLFPRLFVFGGFLGRRLGFPGHGPDLAKQE
jgi:hypothetical protein